MKVLPSFHLFSDCKYRIQIRRYETMNFYLLTLRMCFLHITIPVQIYADYVILLRPLTREWLGRRD